MQTHNYSYNRQHLIRDGKPWLPSMGEIHYSRCRAESWRDSIRLMKAGGIDIAASYVFWIHHEPEQGVFDFTGCRDIGRFLDICDEEEMPVFLRIGPWCHGEARNGGFPDWLMTVPGLRSNHPDYMAYVRLFWEALYEQIKRHIGGCVIGIQYENEFHGSDEHIDALVRLADEIGLCAPLHTATGWGSAAIGQCLPVTGGYCDEPWDSRLYKLPPSANYVFTHTRDDNNIGVDPSINGGFRYVPRFDSDNYPFLTAEIGGGIQPTYHRRPIASSTDVGAIVQVKLGSGTVLPGIYVYHGGTNPGCFLHESKASGYPTDVAELNYDFQAPIGEYGKPTAAYAQLRRIFTFLRDFGEGLAVMPSVIPADNPQDPKDLEHLRYCIRTDGTAGYLFVNNYVRGYTMAEHTRTFTVASGSDEITFPEMTFADGDYGFYPFGMPMGKGRLLCSNAQPLCRLNNHTYVFFTDRSPVYRTEGDTSGTEILTISAEDSLRASKVTVHGRDYLILCDAPYTQDGDELIFRMTKDTALRVYPSPDGSDGFAEYSLTCPKSSPHVRCTLLSENPLMKEYALTTDPMPEGADDLLLDLEYQGNIAELYIDGKKSADQYNLRNHWQIGLRRFSCRNDFTLRLFALPENAPIYLECPVEFKNGFACELKETTVTAEYSVRFTELA